MVWRRFRIARTIEALRTATTYFMGELIVPREGPNAGRLYIGDGVTPGGRGVAMQDELTLTNQGGQCRYCRTSDDDVLKLRRWNNGKYILINGVPREIPEEGVEPLNAATPATLIYVYAFMDGDEMRVERSATGHEPDPVSGVEVKIGDVSRTLVGAEYGDNWTFCTISWYCREVVTFPINIPFGETIPRGAFNAVIFAIWFPAWDETSVEMSASWHYGMWQPDPAPDCLVQMRLEPTNLPFLPNTEIVMRRYPSLNQSDTVHREFSRGWPATTGGEDRSMTLYMDAIGADVFLDRLSARVKVWG